MLGIAGKAAAAEGDEQLEEHLDKLEEENLQLIEENSGLINKARAAHERLSICARKWVTIQQLHHALQL